MSQSHSPRSYWVGGFGGLPHQKLLFIHSILHIWVAIMKCCQNFNIAPRCRDIGSYSVLTGIGGFGGLPRITMLYTYPCRYWWGDAGSVVILIISQVFSEIQWVRVERGLPRASRVMVLRWWITYQSIVHIHVAIVKWCQICGGVTGCRDIGVESVGWSGLGSQYLDNYWHCTHHQHTIR